MVIPMYSRMPKMSRIETRRSKSGCKTLRMNDESSDLPRRILPWNLELKNRKNFVEEEASDTEFDESEVAPDRRWDFLLPCRFVQ
eukprot:767510-Hanusia_phi.AAC.5